MSTKCDPKTALAMLNT